MSVPEEEVRRGLLSRIGTGIAAFGAGRTSSSIVAERAERDIAVSQARLGEQRVEAGQAAVQRQQRQQELSNAAFGGGPDSDRATAQLSVEFPEMFEAISESAGLRTQGQKNEAADFAFRLRNTPFEQRQPLIDERVANLSRSTDQTGARRDPQHTASLTGLSEEDQNNALQVTELLALSPEQRLARARGAGVPAEQRAFESLIADFTPEEQSMARRVRAGLEARAGISAQERIAAAPGVTELVAGSQAIIAGGIQTAKTTAQIDAELARAEETGGAAAREAALVEAAVQGQRVAANRIKTAEEARVLLPEAQAGANEMVVLLNDIRNDPNLPNVLGAVEGRIDVRIDENESALLAKIAQVTGKTFLQAYQSLKGGGPITDTEGRAATEAQSRLTNRTVSLSSYQGAIDELIAQTDARLSRLTRKADLANIPTTPAAPTQTQAFDPALLEFMTPEERALFEQ